MRKLILLAALFVSVAAFGQDARLAQQYFQDGEYEKAAVLYQTLYQKFPESDFLIFTKINNPIF